MNRHKYYCQRCDEVFYRDRVNMNEKHHCGEFSVLDWACQGEDEPPKD